MYGNVLTNRQLRKLIDSRALIIDPFESSRLKEAAYTLTAGFIQRRLEDGEWGDIIELKGKNKTVIIKPNEYLKVIVKQKVIFKEDGIFGNFITASNNVDSGLLIVSGQIDSRYGLNGEGLHFGIKNLLESENSISQDTRLVHLQVVDLRGSASDRTMLTKEQQGIWQSRRGLWSQSPEEGPNYSLSSE